MNYTPEDIKYIEKAAQTSISKHVKALADLVRQSASYAELFAYGMPYLPQIRDKDTGKVDLEKLNGFVPKAVEYFYVLSELPSLPERLKELATELEIYADGEAVQADAYYFSFDPEAELRKAGL